MTGVSVQEEPQNDLYERNGSGINIVPEVGGSSEAYWTRNHAVIHDSDSRYLVFRVLIDCKTGFGVIVPEDTPEHVIALMTRKVFVKRTSVSGGLRANGRL